MKNLAGNDLCDRDIRLELERARIEIVEGPRSEHEVPATLTGKLGEFTFRRAWYYWVAKGPMPIELARELYADPVGRTDVRAGGHCACPSPDEYGAEYFAENGLPIYVDADGSEQATLERFVSSGRIAAAAAECVFVKSKEERAERAARVIVDTYHIDSEVGLRLFADTVRRLIASSGPDVFQKLIEDTEAELQKSLLSLRQAVAGAANPRPLGERR